MVFYVAHNRKSYKKFIAIAALADTCWILIVTTLGWLAGRGFVQLISVLKGVEKGLAILLGGIIIIYIAYQIFVSLLYRKADN